jgi:hypothetical protein
MFICLFMMACGLDPMGYEPGASGDNGGNQDVDRGEPVDNLVYPGSDDVGVLVYKGHDGQALAATSILRDTLSADGWEVSSTFDFPSSFEGIRLVIISNPGGLVADDEFFSDTQISSIQTGLAGGTRFLIGLEPDNCASSSAYALLEALDSPHIFDGNNMVATTSVTLGTLDGAVQPMSDVSTLSFSGPCYITDGEGWMVKNGSNQIVAARIQLGNAGDIVMVGDLEFLMDGAIEEADNEQFARNLAQVTP